MHQLIPPRLFMIFSALMLLAWRFELGPGFGGPPRWSGALLGGLGLVLMLLAWARFQRAQTQIHTFKTPITLVTEGPFRLSRNPMYLSFLLMLLGLSVGLGRAVAMLGPMGFFAVASLWYIPTEEAACERVFGEAYLQYKRKVRRWL